MIFSATVPKYIQEIARKKMRDPLLIDLVGTDTNQIPDTLTNNIVLVSGTAQKNDQIARFIATHPKKKMLIFPTCQKRERVRQRVEALTQSRVQQPGRNSPWDLRQTMIHGVGSQLG